MSLNELVDKSVFILRETKAQFKNPCVLWSTGKDSTVTLSLCREAFFDTVPFPVVHIDTGWKFPEIYEFRDKWAKEWELNLIVAKDANAGVLSPRKSSHEKCCTQLKTSMLRKVIEGHGFDAVIVSIRRDEHYIRNIERVSSPRDKDMRWNIVRPKKEGEEGDSPFTALQNVELWDLYQKDFGEDLHHVRRHPILDWTEIDCWRYVQDRKLPVNPLYFADYVHKTYATRGRRYRSLGCYTCTSPIESTASTIDEVIAELETTRVEERSGRAQDKENRQTMRKLRALGYM